MPLPDNKPRREKSRPVRAKHMPVRTCVACRESGAKRGLTRIVRTPEGEVVIDPTGKRNGRGAYLCDKPGCWERALSTPILSRALNVQLTQETRDYIKEFAAGLPSLQEGPDTGVDSKELS
ncbi:MAG: YlxR family protein [Chloroflexota bacterium]|nr:YlxR family protein [Chloroflexota bacterium]